LAQNRLVAYEVSIFDWEKINFFKINTQQQTIKTPVIGEYFYRSNVIG